MDAIRNRYVEVKKGSMSASSLLHRAYTTSRYTLFYEVAPKQNPQLADINFSQLEILFNHVIVLKFEKEIGHSRKISEIVDVACWVLFA